MNKPNRKDEDQPLYPISVVAQMLGVHPQTLRLYEREGLISPGRTKGKTRLYSQRDVEQLKTILHFTQEMGVNLAGVGLLLELQERMNEMQNEMWLTLETLRRELALAHRGPRRNQPSADPTSARDTHPIKIRIEPG